MAFARHILSWIHIGVFHVAAFSQHRLGNSLLRKESELTKDSFQATANLDVKVNKISWYIKQDSSIEGILFSFTPQRDVYYSAVKWAIPPTRTPDGTYMVGEQDWFVKYVGTFENNSAWKSFKFVTKMLKEVEYGPAGALSETRVAAACRQIVGISFSGQDPSGVVEKMRPSFLTELKLSLTEQESPAVNRLGNPYGKNSRLRTRQAGGPKRCHPIGDVHYNPTFQGSDQTIMYFGAHWVARTKNGTFGVQAFTCGYMGTAANSATVTGALKVRSGNNLILVYGNGTTIVNGHTFTSSDSAYGVYDNCLNDMGGINESDGDAYLSWGQSGFTDVAGTNMRYLDYEVKMDGSVIDNVGFCNSGWDVATPVSAAESYFTQREIDAMLSSSYNCKVSNTTAVQQSVGTGEGLCNSTGVPFVNAVMYCRSFVDTGYRLACQTEYCGSKGNRGVAEYLDRDMESSECSSSRLAMESCTIVENICLTAASSLNVSIQADFFQCQQKCIFMDGCQQATFNSAGRTCTLSSKVAPKPILDQTSRNQNCTSSLCGSGKNAWFVCDCSCYGSSVTSQSIMGMDVCVCADGDWPRCSNSKGAINEKTAKCCEFW